MKSAILACVLLAAMAVIVITMKHSSPLQVLYQFPERFRGQWFLLPDRGLPRPSASGAIVLRFNRHGICRVDEGTFSAMRDWKLSTCQVGGETIDVEDRGGFVTGKVSCDLGGCEAGDNPTATNAGTEFDYGLVGDLNDLTTLGKDPRSPRERLRDALLAESREEPEQSSDARETGPEGTR